MWLLQFGLYSPWSLLSADDPPYLCHSLKIQGPGHGPAIGRAWVSCLFPPCQHLRQKGFASSASTEAGVGVGENGRQCPRVTPVQRPHSSLLMRTEVPLWGDLEVWQPESINGPYLAEKAKVYLWLGSRSLTMRASPSSELTQHQRGSHQLSHHIVCPGFMSTSQRDGKPLTVISEEAGTMLWT